MSGRFLLRTLVLGCLVMLPAAAVMKTSSQAETASQRKRSFDRWEYLVVSGASSTNFTPTGNPDMRKEPGGFGRESFVLEQHLDKLGTRGWELVSVSGPVYGPVYYLKSRK